MILKELNKVFSDFGKYMVTQSKANLTRLDKGKGPLYNSLKSKVNDNIDSIDVEFWMEDYGIFQDQGVKGADPSKVSPNAKEKKQQAPNSPYRFGSGTYSGSWNKFVASVSSWAQIKNIRLRQYKLVDGKSVPTGKFAKGNYETIGQVIAKNIYSRGLKPSFFYTKPFNKAFENLPEDIFEGFAIEIEQAIDIQTKNK